MHLLHGGHERHVRPALSNALYGCARCVSRAAARWTEPASRFRRYAGWLATFSRSCPPRSSAKGWSSNRALDTRVVPGVHEPHVQLERHTSRGFLDTRGRVKRPYAARRPAVPRFLPRGDAAASARAPPSPRQSRLLARLPRVSFRVRRRSFRVLVARRSFRAFRSRSSPSSVSRLSRASAPSRSPPPRLSPPRLGSLDGKGLAAVGSVAAVGETPSRARSSFCAVCGFGRGWVVAWSARKGSRAPRADGSTDEKDVVSVGAKKTRGKTDCRRVASGTHHALVIARLPIDIGHPCAHAGLVYVRKRLEMGSARVPVSSSANASRTAVPGRFRGRNHARPRVGTRKTNACESTTRASRARAGSRGRACVSDRALLRRFVAHHVRACRALVSSAL